MSPQQIEGRPPRPTDDIYALGATLYELLVSQPPFHANDGLPHIGGLSAKVRTVPAKPLEQRQGELGINNPVPPRVAATIMACLAKEPEDRPASIKAVAAGLGLAETPNTPAAPAQAAPRPPRHRRKRPHRRPHRAAAVSHHPPTSVERQLPFPSRCLITKCYQD